MLWVEKRTVKRRPIVLRTKDTLKSWLRTGNSDWETSCTRVSSAESDECWDRRRGPKGSRRLRRLIRRIRNDMTQWQLRQCGGKSRLKHGFVNFLREFHRNPAWQIDVAFVIRDSDCSPPQPIEDQLQHILERLDLHLDSPWSFLPYHAC